MDLKLLGLLGSQYCYLWMKRGQICHFRGDGPNFAERLPFMIHEEGLGIQQLDETVQRDEHRRTR